VLARDGESTPAAAESASRAGSPASAGAAAAL